MLSSEPAAEEGRRAPALALLVIALLLLALLLCPGLATPGLPPRLPPGGLLLGAALAARRARLLFRRRGGRGRARRGDGRGLDLRRRLDRIGRQHAGRCNDVAARPG